MTAGVATSAESTNTNPAVDTNAEQTNSNAAVGTNVPRLVDCRCDNNQCHYSPRFKSSNDYDNHVNRSHKNDLWVCSGTYQLDDGTLKKCKEICTKRSSLWSHYRRHNYCDIEGYYYGSDEK